MLGMNKLRKFKYNTQVPVFEVVAGRGIDWFDLTIRVSYGDQVVPLHELRKAILGRQDFILLADGSPGMVPKEWAERYGLLLRIGQERAGGLRLPALHWAVLAETDLGSSDLRRELEEKRQRWLGADGQRAWPVPSAVQARLRDYRWAGSGGCVCWMRWAGVVVWRMNGIGEDLTNLELSAAHSGAVPG